MNSRECFLTALRGGQPDRVPIFEWVFNLDLYEHLLGHRPKTYNGQDAVAAALKLGLDAVTVDIQARAGFEPTTLGSNRYIDEWGRTYQRDPASWPADAPVGHPCRDADDAMRYRAPDPYAPGRIDDIKRAVDLANGRIAVMGTLAGPFTRPFFLAGPEQFCYYLFDAPEAIMHLSNEVTDFMLAVGERLVREVGVDAIVIADDFGHKTGGFLAPAKFRRFILPNLQREVRFLKDLGVPVLLHSCGNVNMILADLVAAGIDGLNPLQRTAGMNIAAVKAAYGNRICLVGNIDATRTLPYGTPEEVRQEVRDTIAVGAPGGGYILSTDHSFHGGIPVRNIFAMLDAAREFGSYPVAVTAA